MADDWRKHCTWETCGLKWAFFGYRPDRPTNLAFTVLFGIATIVYLVQGLLRRQWKGFTIAMVCGNALEVVGYVGRVLAYNDLWTDTPFLIQIVCLTIAPAFLAAGIYLCLARIVITFGVENSRISARSYPRIFIPCDIFSLVLQAAGGGYASIRTQQNLDASIGNHIMLAGLVVQVVTLLVFILLAIDFAIRTTLRIKRLGAQNALDSRHAALRESWPFKGFLVALSVSTLCIFTRCVYRVAELSEGWDGHLIKVQSYFVGLEGVVIVIAVYVLCIFHPGFCFHDAVESTEVEVEKGGRTWYGGKRKVAVQETSLGSLTER